MKLFFSLLLKRWCCASAYQKKEDEIKRVSLFVPSPPFLVVVRCAHASTHYLTPARVGWWCCGATVRVNDDVTLSTHKIAFKKNPPPPFFDNFFFFKKKRKT